MQLEKQSIHHPYRDGNGDGNGISPYFTDQLWDLYIKETYRPLMDQIYPVFLMARNTIESEIHVHKF